MREEFENLTVKDIFPYYNDKKYYNLLLRLMRSSTIDSDEFIASEAIQIYANTTDDNLKIRILELLKGIRF